MSRAHPSWASLPGHRLHGGAPHPLQLGLERVIEEDQRPDDPSLDRQGTARPARKSVVHGNARTSSETGHAGGIRSATTPRSRRAARPGHQAGDSLGDGLGGRQPGSYRQKRYGGRLRQGQVPPHWGSTDNTSVERGRYETLVQRVSAPFRAPCLGASGVVPADSLACCIAAAARRGGLRVADPAATSSRGSVGAGPLLIRPLLIRLGIEDNRRDPRGVELEPLPRP
jgi:hypothetical protein